MFRLFFGLREECFSRRTAEKMHGESTTKVAEAASADDEVVAEAESTADEDVAEAASTADEVVARAASTADKVVAEAASMAYEVVAEAATTAAEAQSFSSSAFIMLILCCSSRRNFFTKNVFTLYLLYSPLSSLQHTRFRQILSGIGTSPTFFER